MFLTAAVNNSIVQSLVDALTVDPPSWLEEEYGSWEDYFEENGYW